METEGLLPWLQEQATGPCPKPDKSSPHISTVSLRSILIFSSYLRSLPSGLFPSGLPTKILYAFLNSLMRATYSAHLILLDMMTL